jgi:hypothetical protein
MGDLATAVPPPPGDPLFTLYSRPAHPAGMGRSRPGRDQRHDRRAAVTGPREFFLLWVNHDGLHMWDGPYSDEEAARARHRGLIDAWGEENAFIAEADHHG